MNLQNNLMEWGNTSMPGLSRKYLCGAYGAYALINNIDVEQKEHVFWL